MTDKKFNEAWKKVRQCMTDELGLPKKDITGDQEANMRMIQLRERCRVLAVTE